EGAGAMMMRELRDAARSSRRAKLGAILLLPALKGLRDAVDPETYGGAYLLGVRGISVIAHGNSSRRAIRNAILVATTGAEHGLVERMSQRLSGGNPGSDLQDGDPVNTVPHVQESEIGETAQ